MKDIDIPIRLLKAALICAAKQDVRYYLTGIAITDGSISATDGHRLFTCELDIPKDFNMIIPREAVTLFLKQIGSKKEHLDGMARLQIIKEDVAKLQFIAIKNPMNYLWAEQLFKPIDGKYPDVKKTIPNPIVRQECLPYYDWQYLVDFKKISEILGGDKGYFGMIVTGQDTSTVIDFSLTKFENAIGIVMPKRDFMRKIR